LAQAVLHIALGMKNAARREEMPMAMTAPVGRYGWMRVVDVMTEDPLIVTPSETIAQAAEAIVGIVTYVDVLRCFLNRLQEE
jgi:CBS domain-containing protein